MRIRDFCEHPDVIVVTDCHRSADEVPEPVDRADCGVVEWRNEKRAGQMRRMVLDENNFRQPGSRHADGRCEWRLNFVHSLQVSRPIHDVGKLHPVGDREHSLAQKIRLRIAADGDVRELGALDATDLETPGNGLRWKTSPVLYSPEPLFFQRNDELAVAQEDRRSVGVIGIDSEYVRQDAALLTAWDPADTAAYIAMRRLPIGSIPNSRSTTSLPQAATCFCIEELPSTRRTASERLE